MEIVWQPFCETELFSGHSPRIDVRVEKILLGPILILATLHTLLTVFPLINHSTENTNTNTNTKTLHTLLTVFHHHSTEKTNTNTNAQYHLTKNFQLQCNYVSVNITAQECMNQITAEVWNSNKFPQMFPSIWIRIRITIEIKIGIRWHKQCEILTSSHRCSQAFAGSKADVDSCRHEYTSLMRGGRRF